jgi:hypothetical protein
VPEIPHRARNLSNGHGIDFGGRWRSPVAGIRVVSALLFSGISALTLIYTVKRLDAFDVRTSPEETPEKMGRVDVENRVTWGWC